MIKRHKKKIVLLLCVIVMMISINGEMAYDDNVYANITSDKIKEKEKEISQAQQAKNDLQAGLTNIEKVVKELEASKNNLDTYVKELDVTLNSITQNLGELKIVIADKEEEIATTLELLEEAERIQQEQYEAMKNRIKFIYESGDTAWLEMVLGADSFGEFLNKSVYVEELSEYDRDMLLSFIETTEKITALKEKLLLEEEELQEAKTGVENEEAAMNTLISNKEHEIKLHENDISNKEQLIKEYEADIAAEQAAIEALEAIVAAERARIAKENGTLSQYDGGQFGWPAPSYTRISSDFGNRMHPTLGINKFHNGIDLAAPGGSPINAAYNGKVVQASYNGSMGNYVMVDHGGNLYTIYMHASALHVSPGDVVSRGQKIASVGSTGRSTGNHLHFGVRLNGSYVSPWNYLKQ